MKDEDGLNDRGDAVGAAPELPQKTPALQRGPGRSSRGVCACLSSTRCRGDSADGQQGAVQDHERCGPGGARRFGQGGCERGPYFDALAYVPVHGCDVRYRTRRRAGRRCHRIADGPGEQSPTAGGQTSPSGRFRFSLAGQRGVRSGTAGCDWTGRSTTGRRAREAPGGCGQSWSRTHLPGAPPFQSNCPTRCDSALQLAP